MSLAGDLAKFVVDLRRRGWPADVEEKLRVTILNALGTSFAARNHPSVAASRTAVLAMDGQRSDGATLLCDGRKTSVAGAAVANSTIFYGGGQCDTCGTVHIGPIVLPILIAMVETGAPIDRLLPAMLAAYEVAGLFDKPYGVMTAPLGFRATPLYGALGAAAATSVMLDLDAANTASALAMAASFTGGLLQPFEDGSDETRHQPGAAIRVGLSAAHLAQAGVRGAEHAFEGRAGLVRAFARQDCDVKALIGELGHTWSASRITFKPYPVCAFNQTPVTAALALRERIAASDVVAIRVRMNPFETSYAGMDSKGPFHSLTGTVMSIPFCIAVTLVHGAPYTTRSLTVCDDEEVNALVQRIDLLTDPTVPNLSAVIEVDLRDGGSVVQDQAMTTADYGFSRSFIANLVRRIGADQGVPEAAFALAEQFVDGLPGGTVDPVLDAFALLSGR